jgi:hypothetical protein
MCPLALSLADRKIEPLYYAQVSIKIMQMNGMDDPAYPVCLRD